jgi:hypothetical protein
MEFEITLDDNPSEASAYSRRVQDALTAGTRALLSTYQVTWKLVLFKRCALDYLERVETELREAFELEQVAGPEYLEAMFIRSRPV